MPKKITLEKENRRSKLLFEFERKSIHVLGAGYILVYLIFMRLFGHRVAMLTLLATLLAFIVIEFFRITEHKRIPVIYFLWRPKEENSLGGQVYFMLGLILALAIFEFDVALAVVLMTTFGDMAAAIFGIAFGKHWIKQLNETAWEGVIAEFAVDFVICWMIFGNLIIAIPMALTATAVETVFPHIDDNLAIPVFSGFVGQCLKIIFP